MKRLLYILLVLTCHLSVSAQTAQPVFLESFKPVEKTHDFGKIYEKDGKKKTVFVLQNQGKKAVVISHVNTSCGCMVAEFTKRAVRPGEKAKVTVTLDPDHKEGNFVKQVVLLLNDGKEYVRLWVKAHIIPMDHPVQEQNPYDYGYGLWMNQQILPFPDLKIGQTYSFDLRLANDTDKPMTVVFKRVPNNRRLQMPDEVRLKARERTTIKVTYPYVVKYGKPVYINVYPVINGRQGKPLKVKWNSSEKFKMDL